MAHSSSFIYTTTTQQTKPYVLPCAQSSQADRQIDKHKQRDTQSYNHLDVHVHAHMHACPHACSLFHIRYIKNTSC